ncbi:hypothetical protein AAVH_36701, partial [Aphelenchoides avenae]
TFFTASFLVAPIFRPSWAWHSIPLAFGQLGLLYLSFGTYRYFLELKGSVIRRSSYIDTVVEHSNPSVHEPSPSKQLRFSIQGRKNHTIDLC